MPIRSPLTSAGPAGRARLRQSGAVAALALCLIVTDRGAAQAEPLAVRVASDVADLRFVVLGKLPEALGSHGHADGCPGSVLQPASPAARAVADHGWSVTGDAPLGRYRAVSFASDLESATSGTCVVHDGNIGVFDGTNLVALVYGQRGDDAIGGIGAGHDGIVQVLDGDIGREVVGNLGVQADGTLLLSRLPKEEAVCGGRATVPDIRHVPIDKARAALVAKGWTPVRGAPSGDPRQQDLAERGIIEVEDCAGTGLAECRFTYDAPAGTLSVFTEGDADMPLVSDYGIRCR